MQWLIAIRAALLTASLQNGNYLLTYDASQLTRNFTRPEKQLPGIISPAISKFI